MKLRGFILAAVLHGTTIALAFSLMPAQSLSVEQVSLGTVQTQHSSEELAPAQLPALALPPLQQPTITPEEAAPLPFVPSVPEQPRLPEFLPDPSPELPAPEMKQPERQPPCLELPRVHRAAADSPAKRAASEVEPAPDGSSDFAPPALLSWDVPDSFARHFRGRIVAVIVVGIDGKALSVTLERGTGDDDIDREVRKALLNGKYSAASKGDSSIESTLRQPINVK